MTNKEVPASLAVVREDIQRFFFLEAPVHLASI